MPHARPRVLPLIPASPAELLASYERHLTAGRRRPKTIKNYVSRARLFLAWAEENGLPPLARMRRRDIEAWLASLTHLASQSQRQYALELRLFFKWLFDEDEIPSNPMEGYALPAADETDKDVLTPEEMATAFARFEKAKQWRTTVIVAVLYDTGVRAGELCNMRREDVDFATGTVRLRATEVKGRFPRTVPLSPTALRHIDRYLRRRREDSPYLVAGRFGQLTPDGVYDIVRAAFAFTGKVIGPHDLRHTSASHMSEMMGGDELQTLMGWRSSAMARHYTRTAHTANAIAAHRRASPLERLGK